MKRPCQRLRETWVPMLRPQTLEPEGGSVRGNTFRARCVTVVAGATCLALLLSACGGGSVIPKADGAGITLAASTEPQNPLLPTNTNEVRKRGFCGSVLAARMMPPPSALGVTEPPPHADRSRARHVVPATTVTQRARNVLPRTDPPSGSRVCGRSIGTQVSRSRWQGRFITPGREQRHQMESRLPSS